MKSHPASALIDRYEQPLNHFVQLVHAESPKLPIDIKGICNRHRVEIKYKEFSGYRAYLTKSEDKRVCDYYVLIPYSSQGSSYEVFCIAHEFAHFLLLHNFDAPIPQDLNHWQVEEICDAFARRLLIPSQSIRDAVRHHSSEAYSYLKAVNALEKQARIPWIHAARRITEQVPNLIYMRMEIDKSGNLRVISTSLPNRKGSQKPIDPNSEFSKLMSNSFSRLRYREISTRESVGLPIVASADLEVLRNCTEVSLQMSRGGQTGEIRLSATLN